MSGSNVYQLTIWESMIFDGPDKFPNSNVLYHRFPIHEIREMFAYFRQKEEILQGDLAEVKEHVEEAQAILQRVGSIESLKALVTLIKLHEAEAALAYMVGNLPQIRRGNEHTKKNFRP